MVGSEYVVYALTFYLGYPWYYITDEHQLYYPVWYPAPLFRVTDNRLSSYWHFEYDPGKSSDLSHVIVAFKEWALDAYYYDRLTDGNEEDVVIFRNYKKLMDSEFTCIS